MCNKTQIIGDDEVGLPGGAGLARGFLPALRGVRLPQHGVGGEGLLGRAVRVRDDGLRVPDYGHDAQGLQHDQRERGERVVLYSTVSNLFLTCYVKNYCIV